MSGWYWGLRAHASSRLHTRDVVPDWSRWAAHGAGWAGVSDAAGTMGALATERGCQGRERGREARGLMGAGAEHPREESGRNYHSWRHRPRPAACEIPARGSHGDVEKGYRAAVCWTRPSQAHGRSKRYGCPRSLWALVLETSSGRHRTRHVRRVGRRRKGAHVDRSPRLQPAQWPEVCAVAASVETAGTSYSHCARRARRI